MPQRIELNVKEDGNRAIIDVREIILNGQHPRNEIFSYVKKAPVGTVFEIHLPHKAEPLLAGLEKLGFNVVTDQIEDRHFRMVTAKVNEM